MFFFAEQSNSNGHLCEAKYRGLQLKGVKIRILLPSPYPLMW